MGLTSNSLNTFRARIDATLAELFPAQLILPGNHPIDASGVGGKTMSDYLAGGEKKEFTFTFRVPHTPVWEPAIGQVLYWQISPAAQIRMEIADISQRPHENHHTITCKHSRP